MSVQLGLCSTMLYLCSLVLRWLKCHSTIKTTLWKDSHLRTTLINPWLTALQHFCHDTLNFFLHTRPLYKVEVCCSGGSDVLMEVPKEDGAYNKFKSVYSFCVIKNKQANNGYHFLLLISSCSFYYCYVVIFFFFFISCVFYFFTSVYWRCSFYLGLCTKLTFTPFLQVNK